MARNFWTRANLGLVSLVFWIPADNLQEVISSAAQKDKIRSIELGLNLLHATRLSQTFRDARNKTYRSTRQHTPKDICHLQQVRFDSSLRIIHSWENDDMSKVSLQLFFYLGGSPVLTSGIPSPILKVLLQFHTLHNFPHHFFMTDSLRDN